MSQHQPPIFIAFASGKGGVGKSTSCLSIAGALCARGETVHIVDFDQNQTLARWYATNDPANQRATLTVEQPPTHADLGNFIKALYTQRKGYVLIDLAGALTDVMITIAAVADLVIIPSKINEPDFMEAQKLAKQIRLIAERVGKPITHRMLINEVPMALSSLQRQALDRLRGGVVPRFETMVSSRAAYPETFLTGLPPHFSDQSRPAIQKAVWEIDSLVREIDAVTLAQDVATSGNSSNDMKEAA